MPVRLLFFGIVQGVGFRPAVYKEAIRLGLCGFVRNKGDCVEVMIDKDHKIFIASLKKSLPPLARIDRVEIELFEVKKGSSFPKKFEIMPSSASRLGEQEVPIPPDTALCPDCIMDLSVPGNRRFNYPFTNCTDCGARFSVIRSLPYDRCNTSMRPYKMCIDCQHEYFDANNRRLHAQTISCPKDGPRYYLLDRMGKLVKCTDPIARFAKLLDDDAISIAKGWGGMHIICTLEQAERLRRWYVRPQKPFAIMVRDIVAASKYAIVGKEDRALLESPQRPIVLLKKQYGKATIEQLEQISPGLDNIGIYLPYSGFHHILFRHLERDALIMTSANPKGEPMIIDNCLATSLGLDAYLLHDREIVNRVDDSVIIPYGKSHFFIRRSRGWVPSTMPVPHNKKVVSLGAQENVTSSVSKGGVLYMSQYIGDTTNYNVCRFLEKATYFMSDLIGLGKPDAVAIDLHPQYTTRQFGTEFVKNSGSSLIEIQHHWAHAASLMVDGGIKGPIIALSLDGTGYGSDGTVWGGEVLETHLTHFKRIGCLERIPLLGGDKAIHDPRRVIFAVSKLIGVDTAYFNAREAEILEKLMQKSPLTSSFGRVLDALSCRLGICEQMTYDGEPAMKLEKFLTDQKIVHRGRASVKKGIGFTTDIVREDGLRIVRTLPLFSQLEEALGQSRCIRDVDRYTLARGFVMELTKRLVEIAVDAARERGIKTIGLTGGVSYNLPITRIVEARVRTEGLELLLHNSVPNGDGGISAGQNAIAGNLI